jgi:hypothetical protein
MPRRDEMRIPPEEVAFDPASVLDPNGRVFWWRGNVYRAITGKGAGLLRTLLESGAFGRLIDAGVIGTEMTSLSLDGYDLVLSHDTIRFRAYPFEWCDEMLKDAALLTCDVNLALASMGLSTQDAHCWNVLFDGPIPKFVDVGSIVAGGRDPASEAGWYGQFRDFFLYPLHLMSAGQGDRARGLLADVNELVSRQKIERLLPMGRRAQGRLEGYLGKPSRSRSWTSFLERLRRSVENVQFPETATEWSGYYDTEFPSFAPGEDWTLKHRAVFDLLQRLQPSSVVDVGSNRGWYAQLAASMGIPVVAFDADEMCVKSLYGDASKGKLPVLPLVMDMCSPSESRTGSAHGDFYPAARDRLKGDLALGLAMVHHLVFKQGLGFREIVEKLAAFAGRWLLVEFVPPTDSYVSEWYSDRFSWYSTENFVAALRERFSRIELFDSFPAPRQLLLCER